MQHVFYKHTIQKAPIYLQYIFDTCNKTTLMICVNTRNINEITTIADRLLDECTNIQQVIFDHSMDPMHDRLLARKLNSWSAKKSLRSFLLTSEFSTRSHSVLTEILYPVCLFLFKNQQLPKLTLSDKSYLYSCLNRKPSWHRLLFYTLLKKQDYIKNMIYTFYGKDPYNNNPPFTDRNFLDYKQYQEEAVANTQDFPIVWNEQDTQGANDHSISHDAYTMAECNLVTESTVDVQFTSEKLWKPIASGQCFHVVGSPGTNAWLRSFGFETFDKDYDTTTDSVTRLELIVNQLDTNSMWSSENIDKIKHNYHLFHSGHIEQVIFDSINMVTWN